MAKTASNQLGMCLRIMRMRPIPKVSIFMAVTTKEGLKWQGHSTGGIFSSMSMGN